MVRPVTVKFVFVYILLAAVATAVNIGAQDACSRLYAGTGHLMASMIVGTGAGLVVKYVLDKRYIFRFQARDARHDSATFALYTAMGLATTVIFWGVELGFDYLFDSRAMRYAGALIGLSIGYAIKYYLDKRFVFRRDRLA